MTNFWEQLEKQTDKPALEKYLLTKLGEPINQTQTNLYTEILKKISSYYFSQPTPSQSTYSLLGKVNKITERTRKTGKRRGEIKYLLEITEPNKTTTILQVYQENLPAPKWKQIQELAILKQNLVLKYKKFFTNHELLDFHPAPQVNPSEPPKPTIKAKALKGRAKPQRGVELVG